MAIEEPAVAALARIYQDLDARLRQALLTATVEGYSRRRCEALLAQVEAALARLNATAEQWERRQLAAAWEAGATAAEDALAGLVTQDETQTWQTLNRPALEALAKDVAGQRAQFVGSILRQTRDYLRELAAGELGRALGLGTAPREVGRAIRDGVLAQRVEAAREVARRLEAAVGVRYADGSVHSLHAYGEMSARTGMMAAFNEGLATRYQDSGVHLLRVSSHGTLCYVCAPFEDTTWSIDAEGDAAGYERFPRRMPLHPNCRHSWLPVILGLTGEGRMGDPAVARLTDRDLYARMRDEPDGPEKMRAARNGFRNWSEYQRLRARGVEKGPRWREAGIEARRLEAEKRVLQSGGKLSYAQAMSQVTGERMKAEGRGIFAREAPGEKAPGPGRRGGRDADRD